jgi:hypothetical protein
MTCRAYIMMKCTHTYRYISMYIGNQGVLNGLAGIRLLLHRLLAAAR